MGVKGLATFAKNQGANIYHEIDIRQEIRKWKRQVHKHRLKKSNQNFS